MLTVYIRAVRIGNVWCYTGKLFMLTRCVTRLLGSHDALWRHQGS